MAETLKRKVNVSEEPELVGALGAALLALQRLERIQQERAANVIGEEARAAS